MLLDVDGALLLGSRARTPLISSQRHFGIDNELPVCGQAKHYVGSRSPLIFCLIGRLSIVVCALGEPRLLEDGIQHDLTPCALRLLIAL